MKILFQYATRSRVNNFFRGLDSIVNNVSSENYLVNVVCDLDDPCMNDPYTINRIRDNYKNVQISFGNSKNKISAINRMPLTEWSILCNMSDDMVFTTKGFDDVIRQGFTDYFPDLDGVLHFNDGNQKGNCMTMSIIGRKYFERDGYIYHPDYVSLWCDVEAQEAAKLRGKYKYMGDHIQIFKHLHPAWGYCQYDEQYKDSEAPDKWAHDEAVFNKRKQNNFYV